MDEGQELKYDLWVFVKQVRDNTHICTAVAWREKHSKHFVFYKYFCLVLGLLWHTQSIVYAIKC